MLFFVAILMTNQLQYFKFFIIYKICFTELYLYLLDYISNQFFIENF